METSAETMTAAVLVNNGKLEMRRIKTPELNRGECRIRISHCGVCSSDIHRSFGQGAYHYPLIMGHEIAGKIIEIHPGTETALKVGDLVSVYPLIGCGTCEWCKSGCVQLCASYNYFGSRRDGGYAETLNVPAQNLVLIPEGISSQDAALLEPLSVVNNAIEKLEIENKPQDVAVIGGGFLGLLASHLLDERGHRVTVLDRNHHNLKRLAPSIERQLINSDTAWTQFVSQNNRRFNRVLEASGGEVYGHTINLAAPTAVIVWLGNPRGNLQLDFSTTSQILRKELVIRGVWNSTLKHWQESLELLKKGFRPSNFVSHKFALEHLGGFLEELHQHKTGQVRSKIVKGLVSVDTQA